MELLPDAAYPVMQRVDEVPLLEQQLRLKKTNESGSREDNVASEGKDYSPSCSSWAPSDEASSSDESDNEKETKSMKMEQYVRHYAKRRNSKNVPIPVHRPNAVVNVLKERQKNMNSKTNNQSRKRKHKETQASNKSLPDSTKKYLPPPKTSVDTININKKNILDMKASFEELFKIIDNMKPESERRAGKYFDYTTAIQQEPMNEDKINAPVYNNTEAYDETEKSPSEESNRSDDNVLISNKYSKMLEIAEAESKHLQILNTHQNADDEVDEWVPIGSGKTLIHKDKFSKVKWRSYTIATRTLLLATFPRRILATHSLTGKRSPAFRDKPAKMCLDPKIVSDIIIEITSRFNVKENLVRSAITTKCADECKMLKTRSKRKNKLIQNQENAPPSNAQTQPRQVKTEQSKFSQE
ncbi:uncharacterized protein LOC123873948 isoform X2 [Maniola jurtina]|uniref:uncharacterized protein LOC123873948 isoform X2 n=1 Tax=Maniola jurtina TaxID=191418 RepID=UPI001E68B5FB|nr:uncharacterized protein LOC123873948 isoform X2 [Maniola jurtina]